MTDIRTAREALEYLNTIAGRRTDGWTESIGALSAALDELEARRAADWDVRRVSYASYAAETYCDADDHKSHDAAKRLLSAPWLKEGE